MPDKGLTSQYLRYRPAGLCNLLSSGRGGVAWGPAGRAVLASVDAVVQWDLRTGERQPRLYVEGSARGLEVTALAASPAAAKLVAAGYSDGSVRLWALEGGAEDPEVTFTGHRSAVTCLGWDGAGLQLVSGARDCSAILWDPVGECGLARLQGHKGPVTAVALLAARPVLLTASRDTTVKWWDLRTQHCFKTLTAHTGEVWGLALLNQETQLVTGSQDSELRVWSLHWQDQEGEQQEGEELPAVKRKPTGEGEQASESEEKEDDGSELEVARLGSILRKGEGRVSSLVVDPTGRVLGCHGSDNLLELFLVCTQEEVDKRVSKRQKKERKRLGGEGEVGGGVATLQEMVRRAPPYRAPGKLRGLALTVSAGQSRCLIVLANNQVEEVVWLLGGQEAPTPAGRLDRAGHRSDVRALAWSSDSTCLATGSSESVKVWNRTSLTAVRSLPSSYCLALAFCPGDRHLVAATKTGTLQLFDLGSGQLTETVEAHSGEPAWALALSKDGRGFVSGGGDKTVKFWEWQLTADSALSAVHKRTLSVDESVVAVALSPDGRLMAAALLDTTVKVFFVDSLKMFLSLYGHKLPVTCLDISSDSTLIVTGSADRNMKIWGLDFGDCHKSLFCHDDTVTGARWLPDTHRVVTSGKDGQLKMWDGDSFVRIQSLPGHVGEVWGLAVSPNGKWVVSGGKDRTVRLWEKTKEILVLEDERETEREEEAEQEAGERAAVPGGTGQDLPSRRTADTERGAEGLMEALELWRTATAPGQESAPLPPLMAAYGAQSPLDFMTGAVGRVASAQLEEVLLVLPLDLVQELLTVLERMLQAGLQVELATRCLLFLLEIHHGPLSASATALEVLSRLQNAVGRQLDKLADTTGTNLAGLRFLADRIEEKNGVEMFTDSTIRQRERNKKKKKKERALQRAVMSL